MKIGTMLKDIVDSFQNLRRNLSCLKTAPPERYRGALHFDPDALHRLPLMCQGLPIECH